MMGPKLFPARLEIIGGETATFEAISENEGNGRLVVKPQQIKPNLSVYMEEKDQNTYLGFCFQQKKNKKSFVLGVEGEAICFKETQLKDQLNDLSNKFLFKWDTTKGSYGSLKSVVEPHRYLCVRDKEVALSPTPDNLFKVELNTMTVKSRRLDVRSSAAKVGHSWNTRMQCSGWCCTVEPPQIDRKPSRKRKASCKA